MFTEEQTAEFDRQRKVEMIRWYNLSFKKAVEKLLASGKISKYNAEKLLKDCSHMERTNIPSKPRQRRTEQNDPTTTDTTSS